MCHNLLVKSSSEKVIVVEVADVSSKAAKGKDLVEAKLKYEHLLSINKGERGKFCQRGRIMYKYSKMITFKVSLYVEALSFGSVLLFYF